MKTNEFKKLVADYGTERAEKAVAWFCERSAAFRQAVKAYEFCVANEYLWV